MMVGRTPKEVAFRIDAYRDKDGLRELLSTHLLRTLEGLPVSCQTSWKGLPGARGSMAVVPEEEMSLTLRPLSPQGGWISVEASLTARLLPEVSGAEPVNLNATETRTVSLGLPFELSITVPGSKERKAAAGEAPETYVVQITPYLP
jgi:hypothetical protein